MMTTLKMLLSKSRPHRCNKMMLVVMMLVMLMLVVMMLVMKARNSSSLKVSLRRSLRKMLMISLRKMLKIKLMKRTMTPLSRE